MPKVSPIQNAFNAGLFSPLMDGRVDFDKYRNSLSEASNVVPLVQGGLTARPGTAFVARGKDSTSATRLVPFEFSTTQAYILEWSDQNMRVFRDNASVLEANTTITAASQANPCQITTSAPHGYSNGDEVYIDSVGGMTELNGKRFLIAGVAPTTFTLQDLDGTAIDSTGYTAYTLGGTAGKVFDLVLPYLEADLFDIRFAQSADVLYVAHPSYAPRKISRTGHAAWTISQIDFQDGPYLNANTTATTLTPSGTSGSVTVTASAVTGINDDTGFQSTDVGRLIRFKDGANNWSWLEVTAYTSTTQVTATIQGPNLSAAAASSDWRLGVWSDTTGWPAAVSFFENRLFWGGPTSYPQRVDGSVSGDYENHSPSAADGTVADDDAVAFTLNANNVNVIRWLVDGYRGLVAGTVGGEWVIAPSINGEALTPTNIKATRPTTKGSANIGPVRADRATLFVQRSGRKVREIAYVFEDDGYRAPDMTILAEDITQGGIIEMAYQQDPQSIVWCVRGDGALVGLTYERDQDVVGWHPHTLGGFSDSGGTTPAKVESVAVIPSADGSRDEVWVVVNRYIDGGTKRYIEYMTKLWETGDEKVDAWFVDSGLQYSGVSTTTISGLDHLEGETVDVLRDGDPHPQVTVTNGAITLTTACTQAQIGYVYNCDAELPRFNAGAADGTAQGKTQRLHAVTFRLMDTLGLEAGPSSDKLTALKFRVGATFVGQSPPLFNGDIRVAWEGDYSDNARVYLRQPQPLPMTVLAVMPQLHTQDR